MGFKLFSYTGERVFYSHDFLKHMKKSQREVYSDAFVFESSTAIRIFVLVLLNPNKSRENLAQAMEAFFTLGFYSWDDLEMVEMPFPIWKQQEVIYDIVRPLDCGGNILDQEFLHNPTYLLTTSEKLQFTIVAETQQKAFLMIYLVKAPDSKTGKPYPEDLTNFELIQSLNSGHYYMGVAKLSATLEKGKYFVFVSFQGKLQTNIRLTVKSFDGKKYSQMPYVFERDNSNKFTLEKFCMIRNHHNI